MSPMGGWVGVGATAVAAMLENKAKLVVLGLGGNDIGPEGAERRWLRVGGRTSGEVAGRFN